MKKIVLFLSIIIASSAMTFTMAENKPSGGEISLEVNFIPLSVTESPIQMDFIRGRYFLSNTMAVRVGFLFNINSDTDSDTPDPDNLNNIVKANTRIIDFGLAPGIEMHFPIGERVSPYAGAELGIWTRSSNFTQDNNFNNDKITSSGFDGFTTFGINLIAGVDVHIWKGLFLGAEFGFGFNRTTFPDFTETVTAGGTSQTETVVDNSSLVTFGSAARPGIRLGWTF